MIRLTKIYAKLIDKLTIEEAPDELNGVAGFKYDAQKCIDAGYFPVKFNPQIGNVSTYELIDNEIIQNWINIDVDLYSQNVVAKIREKYSENDELSILRKAYSGIDKKTFDEYNSYCENCKREVKLQMVNN